MRLRLVEGQPLEVGVRPSSRVLGVEHEYRVFDGDEQVDFERLLHHLDIEGLRLDPTDPNAYRTSWGGIVTSDGREAEVATAPVALRPGCTSELEWRTVVAQRTLCAALPDTLRLDGYSTHLNVEVDDRDVVAAGRLFVRHFAPAMMLLLDRPTSPGLLVRPRCGRLELGGEYCTGDQLRAAAAFAAAGALTCAAASRSRDVRQRLPRSVRTRVRPANVRAGWYVDRRAFGPDLYRYGRTARLHARRPGLWTAQHHLVDAWHCARPSIEPFLADSELVLVDDVVDGRRPLPLEAEPMAAETVGAWTQEPFGRAVHARIRPRYRVEPLSIAWDAVAFRLHGARDAVACIPRAALAEFFDDLDSGHLDATIEAFLATTPEGLVLQASEQTDRPGLFDELGSPGAIVPPERVPGRPRRGGRGGGTPRDSRRDKRRRGQGRRRALFATAMVVVLIVLTVTAYALLRPVDTAVVVPGQLGAPFVVVFTVESANVGPHFNGGAVPAIGSHETVRLDVKCGDTCVFGNGGQTGGPFVDLGLPFQRTSSDFLTATRDVNDFSGSCAGFSAVHEEATLQLRHDANGVLAGFTGRFEVRHPSGVEATTPSGTCSTFDVSYSFVGTPA